MSFILATCQGGQAGIVSNQPSLCSRGTQRDQNSPPETLLPDKQEGCVLDASMADVFRGNGGKGPEEPMGPEKLNNVLKKWKQLNNVLKKWKLVKPRTQNQKP